LNRFLTHFPDMKGGPLPELVLLDDFHLSVFVPDDKNQDATEPISLVLDSPAFQTELLQAIRHVFQQRPALNKVVVRLSR
jgi:hypothetical protein